MKIFSLVLVFVARFIMGFFMQDEQPNDSGKDQLHSHHTGIALQAEFCCTDENENENEVEGDDDSESHLLYGDLQSHFSIGSAHSLAVSSAINKDFSLSGADRIILLRNFRL